MTDKELLRIYMVGFNDCPDNNDQSEKYEGLAKKAYNLGWAHFIIGDDVMSVNYLSGEEILERIKG